MSEERGFFGILPKGPVRKMLTNSPEWKERPLFGVIASTPEEIRGFRRGVASAGLAALLLALYLETVIGRVPKA